MWANEMTDEVFETREEAVESIYDELYDYEDELFSILSEYDATWIFEHLTPEAREVILEQWSEKAIENWLSECDDE